MIKTVMKHYDVATHPHATPVWHTLTRVSQSVYSVYTVARAAHGKELSLHNCTVWKRINKKRKEKIGKKTSRRATLVAPPIFGRRTRLAAGLSVILCVVLFSYDYGHEFVDMASEFT